MDKNVISEIVAFHNTVLEKFAVFWQRAKENIGLYGINHWTDSEQARFNAAERVALNIPILTQKINSLLGFERRNRTESTYVGIGEEDELNGEILTKLVRWTENANTPKYNFIKSDVFRDGVIPCYGALEIYVEEDYTGRKVVRFERVPYNNVVWDLNCIDFELKSCSRMQKVRWVYIDQLIREYPSKKKELEETTVADYRLDNSDYMPVGTNFENYYQNIETVNGKQKYLCKEITDYKRVNKTTYDLIKVDLKFAGDDKYCFETKKEAETFRNNLLSKYFNSLQEQGITDFEVNPDEYFVIKPDTKVRVEKTVVTGNTILLDTETLDDDEFPIKILFTYFYDGQFWTPVDVGRDPQHFFDKVFAQIDKSVTEGVKPGKIIYPAHLHPSMSVEDAEKRLVSGEPLYGLDPAQKPFDIVNAPPMLGAYFEILNFNQSILESLYGGQTFQGIPDNPNQSGVAIENLQEAGAQMALNFLESLQRWEDLVGKYVLKLILKHYDYEMSIRIMGEEFNDKVMKAIEEKPFYKKSALETGVGFLKVNSKGQKALSDSQYDIVVQPVTSRKNAKDVKFQKLMTYAQMTGLPVPPKLVGKFLDLTPSEMQELQSYADEQKQQQEKIQKFQANMEIANASKPDSNLLMAANELNKEN